MDYDNVKICGVKYKFIFRESIDMPDTLGLCHSDRQEIWLNETNTEETNTNVALHEILHVIDEAYNLELSERQVTVLATALISFSRDNQELAKHFFIDSYNDRNEDV